ncbi:MAG: hypothetical protein LBE34_00345 [Flavobacteriaceae bacterium]|jgi:hypothetical protein|nr:hypothetical protein [Flavobacteriaceae bacterium]
MRNKILFFFTLLCVSVVFAQKKPARAFPYSLSLEGTQKPYQIIEDIGAWNDSDAERYTKEGLVLTTTKGDNSAFALDEIPFTSNDGVVVEFEYAMYGGDKYNGGYGDGMSFFIYDESKKFSIGSHGAGLGYTYRESDSQYPSYRAPGLDGAYLGVGLDIYGGFNKRDSAINEKREGLPASDQLVNWGKRSVSIRGGMHENNRYKGYPVLFSTTRSFGISPSKSDTTEAELDLTTGNYKTSYSSRYNDFDVRGGDSDYPYFQKFTITILPKGNDGSLVTIYFNRWLVVDRFFYPNEFKTLDKDGKLYTFKTKFPKSFKIGFAGSCGSASQVQIVKNVTVSLPFGPQTYDTDISYCSDASEGAITFDPLDYARFYIGTIDNPDYGDSDKYIDKNSFRFEDEYGYPLSNPHEYTEPGVGTWKYNASTREVTFTPASKDIDEGEYIIYYSAKSVGGVNSPFGSENYRSRPTPIKLTVEHCEKKVTINPNLPIKVRKR